MERSWRGVEEEVERAGRGGEEDVERAGRGGGEDVTRFSSSRLFVPSSLCLFFPLSL